MKIVILCATLMSVLAEPPVNNRYLPPQQGYNGGGFSPPSQSYGPPTDRDGGFGQRQTDAVFRGRPSSNYGAPSSSYNPRSNSRRPSNQYIPPSQPSNQYGPPQRSPSNQYSPPQRSPSNQYGPPSQSSFRNSNQPSRQYGAPSLGQSSRSGSSFGSSQSSSRFGSSFGSSQPSSQYGAPSFGASQPSSQYGAPTFGSSQPSSQYGAPAGRQAFMSRPGVEYEEPLNEQYGPPSGGFGGNQQFSQSSNFGGAPSNQYLPPGSGGNGGGYGGDDGANGEPANYNFEYMVKDDASGNDFGHRESRQGDRAEGLYYVLLPDGRKQTVEYEADQDGYKPKISYEDTGAGAGGYDRNSQNGGYQNGGPY